MEQQAENAIAGREWNSWQKLEQQAEMEQQAENGRAGRDRTAGR